MKQNQYTFHSPKDATSISKGNGYNHCASGRDGKGGRKALFNRTRRVPAGAKGSLRGKKVTMPWPGTKPVAVGGTKKSEWLKNTGPLGHFGDFCCGLGH